MNTMCLIYLSDKTVSEMFSEITLMYDATKFIFSTFFAIVALLISILGFLTFTTVKKSLKYFIEKERSILISNMLEDLSRTKQVFGKEYLNDAKYENELYKFPAIDHRVSFHPNLINKIILKPLKGQNILKYDAWIKKGQMHIKFQNFNQKEDEGVDWLIIYNPDYI